MSCTPQVHGAARDTLRFVSGVADHELASAIDNPTVLPDGRIESCGNFHGAPVAMAADYLAIAGLQTSEQLLVNESLVGAAESVTGPLT